MTTETRWTIAHDAENDEFVIISLTSGEAPVHMNRADTFDFFKTLRIDAMAVGIALDVCQVGGVPVLKRS
jgi:hypothetical protein